MIPANGDSLDRLMRVALSASKGRVGPRRPEAGAAFPIRRIDAGRLVLPTGRLCVSDAYGGDGFEPLNRLVAPGDYPVELVIAELPEDLPFGSSRCAFLVVKFGRTMPSSWGPVTAVAPAEPNFMDDRPSAFVQSGATAVFSPEAGAIHFDLMGRQFDSQLELIRGQSSRFGMNEWANYRPGQDKANVIVCEGGYGDGVMECVVGLTAAGRVSHLVVDFNIADADSP
jgi:hypothetical protein